MRRPRSLIAATAGVLITGLVVALPLGSQAAPTAQGQRADAAPALLTPPPTGATARRGAPDGVRSRLVGVAPAALRDLRPGDRLALDLFPDARFTGVLKNRTHSGDTTTWTGRLAGAPSSSFIAVRVGDVYDISVTAPGAGYAVTNVGDGVYRARELAPGGPSGADVVRPAPGQGGPKGAPSGSDSAAGPAPAQGDTGAQVDVGIVYPAALVTESGGADAMQAQFAQGIAQTNEALANSGLATRVRLVGTAQVAAPTTTDISTMIKQLGAKGDGVYDEAFALREQSHADLVSLWASSSVPLGASCGIGTLGGTSPSTDAERAAFTVLFAKDCATDYRVFPHELGHNFGADHDASAAYPPQGSKPYARGYADVPAKTITVMSYYEACTNAGVYCTRIGYYSNPAVSTPAGRVTGTADANNARVIAESADALAGYRQSTITAGTPGYQGYARNGATLTVSPGDWTPAVSHSYQWFLDGVAITGATSNRLKLKRGMIGHQVNVQINGDAAFYATVAAWTAPVVVGNGRFKTRKPTLKGVKRPGHTLRVAMKKWKPKKAKFRYTWLRNGKAIKKAHKARYRLTKKDRGKKIRVVVTASKKGYDRGRAKSKKVKIRR